MDFVNLHMHTSLGSMLDALSDVDGLFIKIKSLGQKALAITEHGTLASYFKAYEASKKYQIKYIPGCEVYFVNSYDSFVNEKSKRTTTEKRKHVVLLCMNKTGWENLLKINYIGYQNCVSVMGKTFPRINWSVLEQNNEGIIATSGCAGGILAEKIFANNLTGATEDAIRLANIFKDRFYIEIQPHGLKNERIDQNFLNENLIMISQKLGIPLVVGADAHYLEKEDYEIHDVLLAINAKVPVDDPDRHRYGIDSFYVKSGEEIFDFLSSRYGSYIAKEAINNTVNISNMCEESSYLEPHGNHLPIFDAKKEKDYDKFLIWKEKKYQSLEEDKAYMRYKVIEAFDKKFAKLNKEEKEIRKKRVFKEIKVLEENNFSSYMLIVADFIKWAQNNGIMVGCGRGSVGGCLVAYLLDIHRVDPIKYNLIFERFQNAYKKDLPDIDTDFASNGLEKVKEYVINKYGIEYCAYVSNINTYTPKNVIPDLIKSLRNSLPNLIEEGVNYVKISEEIKQAIPEKNERNEKVNSFEEALQLSSQLRKIIEKEPRLSKYAQKIIGNPKEFSTHAAGLCISNKPIYKFAPIRVDKNGSVAVQFEKTTCETNGLVKMDFLGLSTLDVIEETYKNIKKIGGNIQPIEDIPLDDLETYEMIQSGFTKCVFQLGKNNGMILLCKEIKPKNIVDIAVINALGRPSSKNDRKEYVLRRTGRKETEYLHPSLENSLKESYGIAIMEEQLMYVASDVAGWDLNEADKLRKLTKFKGKDPGFVEKLKRNFISGTIKKQNCDEEIAISIWENVVEKFAGYGFNKSHAIAYSINGYITAYLKRHFPSCFFAAYLKIKTEKGGVDKDDEIKKAKDECKRLKINIIPPDINKSKSGYEVVDEETIIMGLSSIKGMGEKAVDEIVSKQPFSNIYDFFYKTDARVVNKGKLEVLAKAGVFDSFGDLTRKEIFENGKNIREKFSLYMKKKMADGYDNVYLNDFVIKTNNEEWELKDKLKYENDVLNELISGNINDMYPGFFNQQTEFVKTPIKKIKDISEGTQVYIEGVIKTFLKEFKIKNGNNKGQSFGRYLLEDTYGTPIELTLWSDDYKKHKKSLPDNTPVCLIGVVNNFNNSKSLNLVKIIKL